MERNLITGKGSVILWLTTARCNVIFVSRAARTIMADTGMRSDRLLIKRVLRRTGLKPEAVVLTHSHFDHAANAAWMKREHDTKTVVHESEAENLSKGDMPIPSGAMAITRGLVSIGRHVPSWFAYEACPPDYTFSDRFDLDMFGISGYVIHTPGHSKGESAIIIDNEIALCGDSLLGTVPGRIFPPFADDVSELYRSWKKLLDTNCRLFIPGHGRPVRREIFAREYEKRIL